MYVCTMCVQCPGRPEEGGDLLGLEFKMVVSHRVDIWQSKLGSSGKATNILNS